LRFMITSPGMVSFSINDYANGDKWKDIIVVYNANTSTRSLIVDGTWKIAASGSFIDENGITSMTSQLKVPPLSMLIGYRE